MFKRVKPNWEPVTENYNWNIPKERPHQHKKPSKIMCFSLLILLGCTMLLSQVVTENGIQNLVEVDLASFRRGTRVVPALTSWSPSRNWFPFYHNGPSLYGWPPATLLKDGNPYLECWRISGSQGTVGVEFPHPAFIQAFGIEHSLEALQKDRSSAPMDLRLWASFQDGVPHTSNFAPRIHSFDFGVSTILLGSARFDANPHHPRQNFTLSAEGRSLKVKTVILEVSSNWGALDSTCVYGLRIYGREAHTGHP
jgi:hypothetical protein